MINHSAKEGPFIGTKEEVINTFLLSIGEIVPNQVLIEEDIHNGSSYPSSTKEIVPNQVLIEEYIRENLS